jgi:hypothetical protein
MVVGSKPIFKSLTQQNTHVFMFYILYLSINRKCVMYGHFTIYFKYDFEFFIFLQKKN